MISNLGSSNINVACNTIDSVRVRITMVMPRSGNVALEIADRKNYRSETSK